MAKKETAEEKLLKIIEATKKAKGVSEGAIAVVAKKKSSGSFVFGVSQVNYFLFVVVLASLIYLGKEIAGGLSLLNENADIAAGTVVPRQDREALVPEEKGFAYYLDKIKSRDIFKPFEKKETGEQGVTTAKAALEKKMQKYKLVGVAWLDVPESATVMFEELSSGLTRFLKEGDTIEDVTIKTIYTDRVVVGHENEEMVIKL